MTDGPAGPAPGRALCKRPGCGLRILWVWTVKRRRMPLDADPTPDGNTYLDNGWAYVGEPPEGAVRYTPHFATCLNPPARKAKARARS